MFFAEVWKKAISNLIWTKHQICHDFVDSLLPSWVSWNRLSGFDKMSGRQWKTQMQALTLPKITQGTSVLDLTCLLWTLSATSDFVNNTCTWHLSSTICITQTVNKSIDNFCSKKIFARKTIWWKAYPICWIISWHDYLSKLQHFVKQCWKTNNSMN